MSLGAPKTRPVAAALDAVGYDTRIIERRLDNRFIVTEATSTPRCWASTTSPPGGLSPVSIGD